ncbi:putative Ig domain-containing protein [Variovorax sp. KK3]|uniref:putative Ig domain-containing protein n=1 Tax=Variovorax sp. KK3 TaxID=1855728 RepID=UPI00097BCC3D|nr:putative Ig domain-containing protein [Variovorax sp. KK3]
MSFRSTEFIDDAARDNQATNTLEIAATGYAWGQIRDMEAWYQSLKDRGLVSKEQGFAVTGYSLGGHLATVFNLLHGPTAPQADQANVRQVVTFNGAGVGGFDQSIGLKALVEQFTAACARGPVFTDEFLTQIYGRAEAALAAGQPVSISDWAALRALVNPPPDSGALVDAKTRKQAQMVIDAIGRVDVICGEVRRLIGIGSGDGKSPVHVARGQIEQANLGYQMALLEVGQHSDAASLLRGLALTYGKKAYLSTNPENQFDVVGATNPSAVSNSQWHIGTDVRVFIEDQPLYRGGVAIEALSETLKHTLAVSFAQFNVKLLIDGYATKDFGDTHSLVLIVDSLNLQNTLLQMLPAEKRTGETADKLLDDILRSASNLKRVDGDAVVGTGQGKSEGDVLENVLNALADLALGPLAGPRLKGSAEGNTWHRVEDEQGFTGRDAFYNVLDRIRRSEFYKSAVAGDLALALEATSGSELASRAHTDFAAFAALYSLSPFVLSSGKPGALEALVGDAWGALYADWQADKTALADGARADELRITDQWLQDRAALVELKKKFGIDNASYDSAIGNDKDIIWEDRYVDFTIHRAGLADATYVRFGDDADDADLTGGSHNDRLYGGAGADTLTGGQGSDHLQGDSGNDSLDGGEGNDTLLGGTGSDTYRFVGSWGADTVIDADGAGAIEVDGTVLQGGRKIAEGVWRNDEQRVLYTLAGDDAAPMLVIQADARPGTIMVRKWREGDLGLAMQDEQQGGEPVRVFIGDQRAPRTGIEIDEHIGPDSNAFDVYKWSATEWAADGTLIGGVVEEGFSDSIRGTAGRDRISGLAGNDALDGREGDDHIEGGAADDLIGGGEGEDVIFGGDGDDYINSSANLSVFGRWTPRDVWLAPQGREIKTQGARWGVYYEPEADGDKVAVWYGSAAPSGTDGDFVDGGAGDDRVVAGGGSDYVQGGQGDDMIDGMGGNDVLEGGDGKDRLQGDGVDEPGYMNSVDGRYHGADFIDGGAGDDVLDGGGKDDALFGGAGDDTIRGDDVGNTGGKAYLPLVYHGNDLLYGEAGNDYLEGGGGGDSLDGGAGDDELVGDTDARNVAAPAHHLLAWGDDALNGGDGNDRLFGGGKDDVLRGGAGNDALWGDQDDLALPGEFHGNDELDGGEGADYLVGGGKDDTLHGGAGNDTLRGDDDPEKVATEFHGADYLDGGAGDDRLEGMGGNDVLLGGEGNDYLDGGEGADYMQGGAGDDVYVVDNEGDVIDEEAPSGDAPASIDGVASAFSYTLGAHLDNLTLTGTASIDATGNALNNSIVGNAGNNVLEGGAGDDWLSGGRGDDVYVFNRGDGRDWIDNFDVVEKASAPDERGVGDTLRFGAGIQASDVVGYRFGDDIVFHIKGTSDQIGVLGHHDSGGAGGAVMLDHKIDRVEFADGTAWDQAMLESVAERSVANHAPTATKTVPTLQARVGTAFSYTVAADTIVDSDAWDAITYSIETLEGLNAPAWLTFDTATRRFSGTPDADSVGTLRLRLWGHDTYGASVSTTVNLSVQAANQAPVVARPLQDQSARQNTSFSYSVPTDAFADFDSAGSLAYAATMADGSDLPSWLHFDAATRTFSGKPGTAGTLSVKVSARDSDGASGSYVFDIVIASSTIQGTNGDDRLTGGAGDETLVGLGGKDTLVGNGGDDILEGGAGDDWLIGDELHYASTATGDDRLEGGDGNDTLEGGKGADTLLGGSGNDELTGGEGDDFIDGGAGSDEMYGNSGNDTFYVERIEGNESIHDFGLGADRLVLGGYRPRDLSVSYKNSALVLRAADGSTLGLSSYFSRPDLADLPIEFADGTVWRRSDIHAMLNLPQLVWPDMYDLEIDEWGTDRMHGSDYSDVLFGLGGDDVIFGYGGKDHLHGGSGNDTLDGWDGNDLLQGGDGNDYLMGGAGSDVLEGGDGDDVLNGVATNTYRTGSPYTLTEVDVLDGGRGNDELRGSTGDDVYVFGRGYGVDRILEYSKGTGTGNVIRFNSDVAPSDVVGLRDTPRGSPAFWLSATDQLFVSDLQYIARVEFADGTVWNQAHLAARMTGTTLTGTGAQLPTLTARLGNQIRMDLPKGLFTAGSKSGALTYSLERPPKGLTIDAKTGQLSGVLHDAVWGDLTVWVTATDELGFAKASPMTVRTVGAAGVITGTAGQDVLIGTDGDESLDGLAGADQMAGGAGNDTYTVDNVTDTIVEQAGEGNDTVRSAVSHTLAANVETLVLIGTGAINGTGNALDNALHAGPGNNVLDGLGGNDTAVYELAGSAVKVSLATGAAQATGGSGTDTLRNIENLTGSKFNDTLTGDAMANVLAGGAGNDVLEGGAGNDTLDGGVGNDTLNGGSGNDIYVFGRGSQRDTITDADASVGNADVVAFGSDVRADQLWFRKAGNNLEVSIIGTDDKLTVNNWYLGQQHHVESFKTSNGATTLDSQVQALVDAMAGFAPPAAGQTTLPPDYQSKLKVVIAANWH